MQGGTLNEVGTFGLTGSSLAAFRFQLPRGDVSDGEVSARGGATTTMTPGPFVDRPPSPSVNEQAEQPSGEEGESARLGHGNGMGIPGWAFGQTIDSVGPPASCVWRR
jgi:hypothetical protein